MSTACGHEQSVRGSAHGHSRPAAVTPAAGVQVGSPPRPDGDVGSAAADHADVVGDPAVIGHAVRPGWRTWRPACVQNWIFSKLSKPLVVQPSSVSSALPLQAAGTAGTEPNQADKVALHLRGQRVLHPHVGAVRVRGIGVQHGGVGPAGGAFLRDGRGDRLLVGLQQVHLERPGAGGDDAFVLEVVDLDEGVVPVAADELALAAQQVERRLVLVLVQLVGSLMPSSGLWNIR